MNGITIHDRDPHTGALNFDLRDILEVLGTEAGTSMWELRDVECLGGDGAEALHQACERRELIPGTRLVELACDVAQVVDGEFMGLTTDRHVWITIRAVDSSAFDVETDRQDVLQALGSRFSNVADLTY